MKKILNAKLKDTKAITLIALVITIVVLIILVGVIISITLGNNGILNRAKLAKEEYSNAQDYEKSQIAELEYEIDMNSRETVTLTKEQYSILFSTPDNKLKDMPNTWNVGVEYSWGSGNSKIYGQRFKGTITKTNKTTQVTTLFTDANIACIVNSGGDFVIRDSGARFSIYSTNISGLYSSTIFCENGNVIMETISGNDRTNADYDVWILYTKK